MEPQELRIGNLVQAEINEMDWQTCIVIGIDIKNVSIETLKYPANTLTLHDSEVHPIPLTEQWLEDFGFEKTGKTHVSSEDYIFSICITKYHSGVETDYLKIFRTDYFDEKPWTYVFVEYVEALKERVYSIPHVRLSHVHDVQNLFYCLTGQELELKKQ